MRIGFYIDDAGIAHGGVGPFAQRVLTTIESTPLASPLRFGVVTRLQLVPDPPAVAPKSRSRRWPMKLLSRRRSTDQATIRIDASGRRDRRLASQDVCDLLHVPYQVPPVFDIPFVCTMHDVQELHFPEFFTPEVREWRAKYYRMAIEQAVRIVVSYSHIKNDLIRFFRCDPNKIVVLPPPYEHSAVKLESVSTVERLRSCDPFLLYPAQTWPHKNHLRLIEALEHLKRDHGFNINLVCTGVCNEHFAVIEQRLRRSPIAERVQFLGVVDERELGWLYQHARAVVIPTLYEAGSFPLVEAMSCRTPVICASTTSLPDTIGDRRFVFDPRDPAEMSRLILRIAADDQFREQNRQNSERRTKELCQFDVAKSYEEMWLDIASEMALSKAA